MAERSGGRQLRAVLRPRPILGGSTTEVGREPVFRALHEIAVATAGVLEPVSLAGLVVSLARTLLQADVAHLYLWDEQAKLLRVVACTDPARVGVDPAVRPGDGVAGQAYRRKQPVVVEDYPRWEHGSEESLAQGVRAAVAAPLLADERVIGVLAVRFRDLRTFADNPAEVLALLSAQVAPAMRAAGLYEQARRAERQTQALYGMAVAIGREVDLAARLERVLDGALQVVGSGQQAQVGLVNAESMRIEWAASRGLPTEAIVPHQPLRAGLEGRAVAENRPISAPNLASDRRLFNQRLARVAGLKSWLAIPLSDASAASGVLTVMSLQPAFFTAEHERRLVALAAVAGPAVREAWLSRQAQQEIAERKRAEAALRQIALHDAVTGLPNRTLFLDRLGAALRGARRQDAPLALLMLDLDRFKPINDSYGHHTGDELLREVGQRLQQLMRASDTAARVGGDEFAVLLPHTDAGGAQLAAERLLQLLEQPFVLGEHTVQVGASIGIALRPEHGDDDEALLRHADEAMYRAKRQGGHRVVGAPAADQHTPNPTAP